VDYDFHTQITLLAALTVPVTVNQAPARDDTNTTTGSSVEIERGQLVRSGQTIEVYDSRVCSAVSRLFSQ
jgi:hypothetical protein